MTKNKLYFGDNLQIMREYIPDESIDLIYLDPPFNSKATYNVLFEEKNGTQSRAQITAFEDTWHWGIESENAYHEIVKEGPKKIVDLIQALRSFLGQNDMMAYLVMMAIRLIEMHRVLKPNGSIYLHCDPTASHYLKILMDSIFGNKNFKNEIIWHYRRWTGAANYFLRMHDVILFYTKTNNYKFNVLYTNYTEKSLARKQYYHTRIKGDDVYVTNINKDGVKENDVWIIPVINSQAKERLGYPTQKPEALLERIIKASSDEGDIVMDPFCGCGTAIAVAEQLKRKWIGIDITYLAINLIKRRLFDTFGADLSDYEVIGDPKDLQSARALAEYNRFQFEWWALDKVDARPAQDKKKGADSGIDGYIKFFDDYSGIAKEIIIQVKSGHVSVSQIRDLKGVLEREKATIGAFITLEEPTKPMIEEAVSAGFYEPKLLHEWKYPRIQILTIKDLLENKQLQYPHISEATFKEAKRKIYRGEQGKLI
jgi:site-specific DNA-methyltransferase (adenine-specific)